MITNQKRVEKEAAVALKGLQRLNVNWASELYIVSQKTLDIADHRRKCWVCGDPFKIGDGMTIVNTDHGNKTVHSACHLARTA